MYSRDTARVVWRYVVEARASGNVRMFYSHAGMKAHKAPCVLTDHGVEDDLTTSLWKHVDGVDESFMCRM